MDMVQCVLSKAVVCARTAVPGHQESFAVRPLLECSIFS